MVSVTFLRAGQSAIREEEAPAAAPLPRWLFLGLLLFLVAVMVSATALLPGPEPGPARVGAVDDTASDSEPPTQATLVAQQAQPDSQASSIEDSPPPSLALWPPSRRGLRFTDPVEAALGFATGYVGFTDPIAGPYRPVDDHFGEVEVRSTADSPPSVILVHQQEEDGSWWVLGASAPNIVVDEPVLNGHIGDPLHISGRAVSIGGELEVQIRSEAVTGPVLRVDFATGGGEEPQWFEGAFGWTVPDSGSGAVVFLTRDPVNGAVLEATVVPVRFPSP